MENFCKRAESYERDILQRYIGRCAIFYAALTTWFYLTVLGIIFGPQLSDELLPTHAKYPFDVEHEPLTTIIYMHQSYAFLQISSQICLNVVIALLLWFTAARFEMLSKELRASINVDELIRCIQKHQLLLRYANEVVECVRYLMLIAVGSSGLVMLISGLVFVSRQPLIIKIQFMTMGITSITKVFMCCWPANYLMHMSMEVGQAAYESPWYTHNVHVQKNLPHILLRCQKSVAISVSCFIPSLSLAYFCSFVSTAFSYFTTLRMVIGDVNDNNV